MGVVKAMLYGELATTAGKTDRYTSRRAYYCPIAPMLNTAPIATGDANPKRPSKPAIVSTNQTLFTGVFVLELTLLHHLLPGIAPSRLYAKMTREEAMVQPWPTKNCAMMLSANIAEGTLAPPPEDYAAANVPRPGFLPRTWTHRLAMG